MIGLDLIRVGNDSEWNWSGGNWALGGNVSIPVLGKYVLKSVWAEKKTELAVFEFSKARIVFVHVCLSILFLVLKCTFFKN